MEDIIECTYDGCFKRFSSEEAMKRHKEENPAHFYCKCCDIDYEDDMELFQHQSVSASHIVCPICALEFYEEAGRDFHLAYHHRQHQEQWLTCVGCREFVEGAAGYMAHIAKGECYVITGKVFDRLRAEREVQKDFWDTLGRTINELVAELAADTHISGGAPLPPALPTEKKLTDMDLIMEDDVVVHEDDDLFRLDYLPSLTTSAHERTAYDTESQIGSAASNETPIDGTAHHDISGQVSFWDSVPTAPSLELPFVLNPLECTLNPMDFYVEPQKKFCCFGKYCTSEFDTAEDFKAHFISGAHGSIQTTCPQCFKRFDSIWALIAHCETGLRKCRIRHRLDYHQTLRELTGGLLGIDDQDEDNGELRYVATPMDKWGYSDENGDVCHLWEERHAEQMAQMEQNRMRRQ